jgi:hypothetical protein
MSVICYMSVMTWGTALYVARGVGSGSRDVDVWRANGLYAEDRGLQVPMALEHVFTREIA